MISRRDFIVGGASAAALAVTTGVQAAEKEHHHHKHSGRDVNAPHPHQSLLDALSKCMNKGTLCINHCQMLLAEGDTSMKDCLPAALEMTAVAHAMLHTASLKSPRAKHLAQVALKSMEHCEKVCREHEKMHRVCKECAESCAHTISELKKI